MADLQDFGKKIGGARKDVWRTRGLILGDLEQMNAMERNSNIKKDNIWLKPDWEKLIADGTPQSVAYWQNKMRQAIPPKPLKADETSQKNYVEVVGQIRDAVMSVTDPFDIDTFYKDFLGPRYLEDSGRSYFVTVAPIASGIINNKVLRAAQSKHRRMAEEAKEKLFGIPKDEKMYVTAKNNLSVHYFDGESVTFSPLDGDRQGAQLTIRSGWGRAYYYLYEHDNFSNPETWVKGTWFVMNEAKRKPVFINMASQEEATEFVETVARSAQNAANDKAAEQGKDDGKKRKGAFIPPQLRNIKRTGPDYRRGFAARSSMFLNDLKFRGGEFGNWLNEKDRQASLDMAYDALRDLARLLQIRPEDISFDNNLAIAFGARGRGGANAGAAHYEPDREVINLTKMSGAGCLAHEWGHAVDHALGKACGLMGLASESKKQNSLPQSFRELLDSLRYKVSVVPGAEVSNEYLDKINHAKKNLTNWIDSVQPKNLSDEMTKHWDRAKQSILENPETFTGIEYFSMRRGDEIQTHPEVEVLSQICKAATNHGVPRDTKRQFALWAQDLARCKQQARDAGPVERMVKTDFYKGSIEFDKVFSRAGHGYWQSTCEMFARAFDCYIADKIKESGYRSDYLSARADSFILPDQTAAFPRGEERAAINQKFDLFFEDLKQRGILHHFEEELRHSTPERSEPQPQRRADPAPANNNTHYEQMSFDELLFSAQSRASQSKGADRTQRSNDMSR